MARLRSPHQRKTFASVIKSLGLRRGRGAPLRDAFFRAETTDGVRHPMAELLNARGGSGGGRGGQTRVALYLSLLWIGAKGDHSTTRPASFWASLLGLEDPDGRGGRAVRSTWAELEARGFVRTQPGKHPGDVPTVWPLREDGSGEAYTTPTGQAGDTYRRIPESFWESLLPEGALTGAGLAMYLVALRTAGVGQRTNDLTFSRKYVTETFGLGESTRKAGLRNLSDLFILDPQVRLADEAGDVLGRRRRRTVYDLMEQYAPPPPFVAAPLDQPERQTPSAGAEAEWWSTPPSGAAPPAF